MLIIILGHNAILMYLDPKITFKTYLYSFHVYCFFLLPFLYNIQALSRKRIISYAKRLLLPYTVLFVLLLFLYPLISRPYHFSIPRILIAYFTGDQYWLMQTVGFRLLWFMPAMFSCIILRDIYYTQQKMSYALLILSLCFIVYQLTGINIHFIDICLSYLPFQLNTILWILPIGIFIRFLLSKECSRHFLFKLLFVLLAISGSILFYLHHVLMETFGMPQFTFSLLFREYMTFVMFVVLFFITIPFNSVIIRWIGNHSFTIYLIHQPIYNIISMCLLSYFHLTNNIPIGLFALLLTISFSCLLTFIFYKRMDIIRALGIPFTLSKQKD